ncbi:hypothetical protein [Actinoplanes sp. NPDC051851]|uniref:hypothetical protein n=1 Tax=Actinoplanes sp. NPDC051851 TaxID=3154753 RepID=UPI003415DA08
MLGGQVDKRLRGSMRGPRQPLNRRTPIEWTQRRKATLAGGVAALLAVAGLIWAALPGDETEPRPREYRDVTACLLTDQEGVAGKNAAPLWAAMQTASAQTLGQARYLEVTGEQTAANAQTFAGTLILGQCAVIVAAPGIADEAVRTVAAQQTQQKFLVIDGAAPGTPNVTRVSAADLTGTVAKLLG